MVGEEYGTFEDYQEDLQEDDLEDQTQDQKDIQEAVYEETPAYQKKDDLYSLFWKVVKTGQSSKVGNLNKTELGLLDLPVREAQRLALLAVVLKKPGVARFFMEQGEITLATSASKDGWLPELFVSQKTFRTKKRESNLPQLQPKKKKGLIF